MQPVMGRFVSASISLPVIDAEPRGIDEAGAG
jgi:hypothetical protein